VKPHPARPRFRYGSHDFKLISERNRSPSKGRGARHRSVSSHALSIPSASAERPQHTSQFTSPTCTHGSLSDSFLVRRTVGPLTSQSVPLLSAECDVSFAEAGRSASADHSGGEPAVQDLRPFAAQWNSRQVNAWLTACGFQVLRAVLDAENLDGEQLCALTSLEALEPYDLQDHPRAGEFVDAVTELIVLTLNEDGKQPSPFDDCASSVLVCNDHTERHTFALKRTLLVLMSALHQSEIAN
jgi:hypothetical protein